jgi:Spx/MgsR family transcriptional regulator
MITLYGIPNCDTVRKARNWLNDNNIDYQFHNFKKDGLEQQTIEQWLKLTKWEVLLNKKSMTWRKLPDESKTDIDQEKAIRIMLANTSIIKRPVFVYNNQICIGFSNEAYSQLTF